MSHTSIYSFGPIIGKNPRILILGSMPSEYSLKARQYYANPRNAFWPIIQIILNLPKNCTYQDKCKALKENKIALWDVIAECKRQGSLDSAILPDSIITNNIKELLIKTPSIFLVVFNGNTARDSFNKLILPALDTEQNDIQFIKLPSTSPANASISFDIKLKLWSELLDY